MKRCALPWPAAAMALAVLLGLCAIAEACNVPVFRFALERWRPDPYRIVLFHRGEMTDDQREAIRPLQGQPDKALANLDFNIVDLSDERETSDDRAADRALYEALGRPPLPWLVVQYPAHL